MIVERDVAAYCCGPDATIAEVLRRINATAFLFQVVVDAHDKPVGTVTDGDIRRALVRGESLEAAVERCMFPRPQIAAESDMDRARAKLAAARISFLPLVDGAGRIAAFLVDRPQRRKMPAALVMAGGFGKRLGERTKERPKPLLEVAGRPILDHLLGKLEEAGVRDVYISVHYRADQIRAFVAARDNAAAIELVEEPVKLGTAGAVSLLGERSEGPLFVLNGDVLTRADLRSMVEFHEAHGHDLTIAIARYDVTLPYGVVQFDDAGEFRSVDEKPTLTFNVSAGIYLLSAQVRGFVEPEIETDMPLVINRAREMGLKVGVFPVYEYWRDIGRPDDLRAANNDHAEDEGGA